MTAGDRPLFGQLEELAGLALDILPRLTNPTSGLFSHKTHLDSGRYVNQGANPFYTAICLIGLVSHGSDRAAALTADLASSFDAVGRACEDPASPINLLACALWSFSLAQDSRADSVLARLDASLDPPRQTAMELGLVMSGLSAAAEGCPRLRDAAVRLAGGCAPELLGRFSAPASLFSGIARADRGLDALHARVTTFASQVYPIHGLAEYARVVSDRLAPEARAAADRIVDVQGSLGQWWWIYSVRSGEVLEGYPVYVVHQDAMAFLALAALQNIGEGSYESALHAGLEWAMCQNELGRGLIQSEPPFFARALQRKGTDPDGFFGLSRADHWRVVLASLVGRGRGTSALPRDLEILDEDRPYHLGWLLHATALVRDWQTGL
jgi:hypothetical protein